MVREVPLSAIAVFLTFTAVGLGLVLGLVWLLKERGALARAAVRRLGVVLAVFYVALSVYLANGKRHLQVDTQPAVFGAMSLVRYGWFDLTPFERNVAPLRAAVLIKGADGCIYTRYPPGSTIACVPFVLQLAWARQLENVDLDLASKLSAAVCAALSVAFLFAALSKIAPGAGAWIATIAYAFGTTLLSTASQDAWQHAPAMLGLSVALFGISSTYPDRPRAAALIGFGFGWAVISRLTAFAPAALVAGYFLLRDRKRSLPLALGALPFAVFWIVYAWRVYGSPLTTGYAVNDPEELKYAGNFAGNFYSTFFDQSRGILVFSPFLLLAAAGFWPLLRALARRRAPEGPLGPTAACSLGALALAASVAYSAHWWGGWSYGYRTCSECATLLAPAFALAAGWLWSARPAPLRWASRAALVGLVGLSIGIHALEWAFPNDLWNARPELQARPQALVHLDYARYRLGLLAPAAPLPPPTRAGSR